MSVKTRILSIQLIEKLKNDPAFAEMTGIRYIEKDMKDFYSSKPAKKDEKIKSHNIESVKDIRCFNIYDV